MSSIARSAAALPAQSTDRLSWLVWAYFLTLVLPVVLQAGPLSLSSLRILCLITVLPLLFGALTGRYGRTFWADWFALGHVMWMGLTLFINEGSAAIQLTGSMGVEFLGGYLIARATIRNLETFQRLCILMTGTILFLFPFALYEAITGDSIILSTLDKLPGLSALDQPATEMRIGLHRVQSVFSHPIHLGLFASVAFALCYTALEGVLKSGARFSMALAVAATGFLSLSSGGILALALQMALIAWAMALPAQMPRWWFLTSLFALAYVAIDLLSNRTPVHVFMSYATFSSHTAYWRMLILEHGMNNVWANPLWGLGMGDWVRPAWMHTPSVDNFWLLNAMRHGILGFLTLAACWLAVIIPAMRRPLDSNSAMGRARRAWVFSILGLCCTLITVHAWGNIYSFVMFLLGAGAWFATADEAIETTPKESPQTGSRHTRFAPPSRPARA